MEPFCGGNIPPYRTTRKKESEIAKKPELNSLSLLPSPIAKKSMRSLFRPFTESERRVAEGGLP